MAKRGFEPRVLRLHIDAAKQEFQKRSFASDANLREEMGKHLHSGMPAKGHFSDVVCGRRRITGDFLSALHKAFGFDHLGIPITIWFVEDIEAEFIDQIRSARSQYLDVVAWLRRVEPPTSESRLEVKIRDTLLGIGVDYKSGREMARSLKLGQKVHLDFYLPFEGWLTLFNLSPKAELDGPVVHWIDPPLHNIKKKRPAGRLTLPQDLEGVQVGHPTGPNTLISVLWRELPEFSWPTISDSQIIDEKKFRDLFVQELPSLNSNNTVNKKFVVSTLDYEVKD